MLSTIIIEYGTCTTNTSMFFHPLILHLGYTKYDVSNCVIATVLQNCY